MKAILVIDVADDVAEAYEDFTVDYDLRGTPKDNKKVNESIKYVEDAKPKPMPNEACKKLVQGLDAMEKMKAVEVRVVRRTE